MALWVWAPPPKCTKGDIDRAGAALISDDEREREAAADIVNGWRAAHGFPLNTAQMTLRGKARRQDLNAIVGQRLKRISSIQGKLARVGGMQLSRMQDIGGCRAILQGVEAVLRLAAAYEEAGYRIRNNYIEKPKEDGYRSIHLIWKYEHPAAKYAVWNGYQIEIQLRSKLQHAFSTSVETVTAFTGEPLKFGGGDDRWRRFFSLMGTVIAGWEGSPSVPGTPEDPEDVRRELSDLANALGVRYWLDAWSGALKVLPSRRVKGAEVYLLLLNTREKTIQALSFATPDEASRQLLLFEKEIMRGGSDIDAVQVSAASVHELKRAYPNYYSDTKAFLSALRRAIGE